MIELKDVTKRVGAVTHIKPTSLKLAPGHFNVLLGATGAGKTSLIKLMAGLDPMASGQILMDGEDVTRLNTQKRRISLVHQFFVNYPHMSVFENIASPLRVAGLPNSEIQGRVAYPWRDADWATCDRAVKRLRPDPPEPVTPRFTPRKMMDSLGSSD